jgi:sugar lactone lactonase YvrE
MNHVPEIAVPAAATLGEGVCWDAERQCLYWVDILEKELHIHDPATGTDRCIQVGQYIGATVPTADGNLLLALQNGLYRFDLETEAITLVCNPEADQPNNRFNDGKCDPAGRFWAGTMQLEGQGKTGALYRMDADLCRCIGSLTAWAFPTVWPGVPIAPLCTTLTRPPVKSQPLTTTSLPAPSQTGGL